MPHLENVDMESRVLSVLVLCHTGLIEYVGLSVSLSHVSFVGYAQFQDSQSLTKLRIFSDQSAHLKNIKVDVTCYRLILDCLQIWRSIAFTMTVSKDKIRLPSHRYAKEY